LGNSIVLDIAAANEAAEKGKVRPVDEGPALKPLVSADFRRAEPLRSLRKAKRYLCRSLKRHLLSVLNIAFSAVCETR
jgi:hypothetical protein